MAEHANTPAHDLGKMKKIEAPTESMDHSVYFAELDAMDRESARLNKAGAAATEAEWKKWDERTSRIWGQIEALPSTPENAKLKARAVWSLTEGDLANFLLEGESLCTRLARQVFHAFSGGDRGEKWSAIRQSFKAARAAEVAFDDKILTPAFDRAENGGPSIPEEISAESTRLTDIRTDAEIALIATPAPDLPGVIWKIEYARERWQHCEGWPDNWWAAIMLDLNRIAAGEAA